MAACTHLGRFPVGTNRAEQNQLPLICETNAGDDRWPALDAALDRFPAGAGNHSLASRKKGEAAEAQSPTVHSSGGLEPLGLEPGNEGSSSSAALGKVCVDHGTMAAAKRQNVSIQPSGDRMLSIP